jgi:stage II sporulation protein D
MPPSGIAQRAGYILAAVILAAAHFSCAPSGGYLLKKRAAIGTEKQYVRVLIARTGERVIVSSASRVKITDIRTRRILYDGSGKKLTFHPDKVPNPVAVESWDSPLVMNGRAYRGTMEMHENLGKILVINVVTMDAYLYGVVPCEISSGWDGEALKAQAVAARTYTYHHLMNGRDLVYDLDATSSFQVYGGLSVETESTRRAVNDTSGEIAVYRNRPIVAYFHSTCGGLTADAGSVWNGGELDYLKPVRCEYCRQSPHFEWQEKVSLYDIRRFLGKKYRGIGAITGISLKKTGDRVAHVNIAHRNGTLKISGNEFRLLFPEKKIRSLFFDASKTSEGLVLRGHGWGHGVGLCQWGANGMAARGANYRDILSFYYKGIRVIQGGPGMVAVRKKPGTFSSMKHPAKGEGKV